LDENGGARAARRRTDREGSTIVDHRFTVDTTAGGGSLLLVTKGKRETFGQRIRRLREEKRITQGALAERCGISGGYLSRVESDEQDPPGEGVIRIMATVLAAPVDELLAHAGRVPSDVQKWLAADPARIAAVRALMGGNGKR
jgi:DNA-binding XRE family transcriptional regulator